jgi:hypothetical protein
MVTIDLQWIAPPTIFFTFVFCGSNQEAIYGKIRNLYVETPGLYATCTDKTNQKSYKSAAYIWTPLLSGMTYSIDLQTEAWITEDEGKNDTYFNSSIIG